MESASIGATYGGRPTLGRPPLARVPDRALKWGLAVLAAAVDLLAAVPSVVYGLWGFFVLIPKLRPAEQWFSDTFSFLPFIGGHVAGPGYFVTGLVLAIMIIPIVSAISR